MALSPMIADCRETAGPKVGRLAPRGQSVIYLNSQGILMNVSTTLHAGTGSYAVPSG